LANPGSVKLANWSGVSGARLVARRRRRAEHSRVCDGAVVARPEPVDEELCLGTRPGQRRQR
jgi:hypothetical protein